MEYPWQLKAGEAAAQSNRPHGERVWRGSPGPSDCWKLCVNRLERWPRKPAAGEKRKHLERRQREKAFLGTGLAVSACWFAKLATPQGVSRGSGSGAATFWTEPGLTIMKLGFKSSGLLGADHVSSLSGSAACSGKEQS